MTLRDVPTCHDALVGVGLDMKVHAETITSHKTKRSIYHSTKFDIKSRSQ